MNSTRISNLSDRIPVGVTWAGDQCDHSVGKFGITKMEIIQVPGPMGYHPWIEVYRGDILISQLNCSLIEEIRYDDN